MNLSPAAAEDAIRLLDERLSGVKLAEEVGDILERIDVGRMYLRAKQLAERATGIETILT